MAIHWKDLLKQVAPGIASVLGGPLGGMAIAVLSKTLLKKDGGTEDEIAEVLATAQDPALLVELKKADQQFAVEMKKLDIDVYRLEHEEKASARSMYATNYWPQITLSSVFVGGYFAILYFVMAKTLADIPPWQQAVITTVFGVLTAAVPQILGFWFGSSFGSKEKTTALANSTPK